jgi:hypothetical protein
MKEQPLNEELDEREVIEEIWSAHQQGQVITALVDAKEIDDAVTAMRWASKLAGLRHGAEIAGFDRPDVFVCEPPYPDGLGHYDDDPSRRLLLFRPRPPWPAA